MKKIWDLWDMPIILEVIDRNVKQKDFSEIYDYFIYVDNTFSTFKTESEITKINKGIVKKSQFSTDMKKVLKLSERTRKETFGYFNIFRNGKYDPLGIVKGWAIKNAAEILRRKGYKNYYIEAGGDIQVSGKNRQGKPWKIGIRNPFNIKENVKIISVSGKGVATSGTYMRGQHIYNPFRPKDNKIDIVSLTVIGPDILEADRFATAAFAMGKKGINFIEKLKGLEGYMIDHKGIATFTSNFAKYVYKN